MVNKQISRTRSQLVQKAGVGGGQVLGWGQGRWILVVLTPKRPGAGAGAPILDLGMMEAGG